MNTVNIDMQVEIMTERLMFLRASVYPTWCHCWVIQKCLKKQTSMSSFGVIKLTFMVILLHYQCTVFFYKPHMTNCNHKTISSHPIVWTLTCCKHGNISHPYGREHSALLEHKYQQHQTLFFLIYTKKKNMSASQPNSQTRWLSLICPQLHPRFRPLRLN